MCSTIHAGNNAMCSRPGAQAGPLQAPCIAISYFHARRGRICSSQLRVRLIALASLRRSPRLRLRLVYMAQPIPIAGGFSQSLPTYPPGTWYPTSTYTGDASTLAETLESIAPAPADGGGGPASASGERGTASAPAAGDVAVVAPAQGEPVWPPRTPFTMDDVLALRKDYGSLQALQKTHPRRWGNWLIKYTRYLLTDAEGASHHVGVDLTSAPATSVPTWISEGNRNGRWDFEQPILFRWPVFLASLDDAILATLLGDFGVAACHILELPGIADNLLDKDYPRVCKWEMVFTRAGADGLPALANECSCHPRANGKVDCDWSTLSERYERERNKGAKGIVAGLAASYPATHNKPKASGPQKKQEPLHATTPLAGGFHTVPHVAGAASSAGLESTWPSWSEVALAAGHGGVATAMQTAAVELVRTAVEMVEEAETAAVFAAGAGSAAAGVGTAVVPAAGQGGVAAGGDAVAGRGGRRGRHGRSHWQGGWSWWQGGEQEDWWGTQGERRW